MNLVIIMPLLMTLLLALLFSIQIQKVFMKFLEQKVNPGITYMTIIFLILSGQFLLTIIPTILKGVINK